MNICLSGWLGSVNHKTKRDQGFFDFGAHIFCVHLYNFAEVAIKERNLNALEFLCRLGALTYRSEGKNHKFCIQMKGEADLLKDYCQGIVDLNMQITLPEKYLGEK